MQGGEQEKKKFVVPSKDELIDQIKALSDQIQHVSLNLIKCDFQAVEKDVEKAFPDFHLIKVKKYNPGSFEVVFESKIDAINFIKTSFDKKILTRRFFIKMGRQQKELAENWTAVGYVPKQFKQAPKKNTKFEKEPKNQEATHQGQKVQQPKAQTKTENKPVQHKAEHKVQHKVQHKPVQHTKPAEHKVIPKIQHKPKATGKKPTEIKHQPAHKVEHKQHKAQPKKDQKGGEKKEHKVEEKKEHKHEQKKAEDDEWIVVPSKKGKPKK